MDRCRGRDTILRLERLPTLDGWRALAILAVMLGHSAFLFPFAIGSHLGLGVDLFFAISGFLITYRLLGEWQADGQVSLRGFYLRRIFRILPPYFFYLGVIGLLAASRLLDVEAWEWWSSALFARNYLMGLPGGVATNHFWSLAVEEHFYVLWPLLLIAAGPRRAKWLAPLLALLVHVWRGLDTRYALFATLVPFADPGSLFRSDTRMDALLWGCTLALWYPQVRTLLQQFRPMASVVTVATLAALFGLIAGRAPMLPLWLAIVFPCLIATTVALPEGFVGRFLERPALRWIGDRSYSLYLWQTLFLQCVGVSLHRTLPTSRATEIALWLGDLVLVLLCAGFSYQFIERPAIRRGRSLAARA